MRLRSVIVGAATMLAATGAASAAAQTSKTASPPQHEVRPAICFTSYDPYRTRISVLRACGDVILPLRHVTPLPGGGQSYDYGPVTQLMPPAHFNVLTASDQRLREYGLPTRAKLGARWYALMRHPSRFAPAPRYLVEVPRHRTQVPANSLCGPASNVSTTWSGYCVTGRSFLEVSTQWAEPSFVPAGCSGDQFRQWAGIGATGRDDLAQAGTTFNVPGFTAHQGFIDTISNGSGSLTAANIQATAGQQFYVSVSWNSDFSEFDYMMKNLHTGMTYSAHSRPVTRDGSTAEVITERPNPTGQLSDYQNLVIKDPTAFWSTNSSSFSGLPHTALSIMDGNRPVSSPGAITASGWTMNWHECF